MTGMKERLTILVMHKVGSSQQQIEKLLKDMGPIVCGLEWKKVAT